jgi:hypothetical protein
VVDHAPTCSVQGLRILLGNNLLAANARVLRKLVALVRTELDRRTFRFIETPSAISILESESENDGQRPTENLEEGTEPNAEDEHVAREQTLLLRLVRLYWRSHKPVAHVCHANGQPHAFSPKLGSRSCSVG